MSLIDLKQVSRIYGEGATEVRALDCVDLTIEQGEIVALLGPSGSGKTTLLNVIAALDQPTDGEYSFEGDKVPRDNVESMTEFRRENIGYIFQFFNLLGDLTAIENITLVQELSGNRDLEFAEKLLKDVGLEGLENRFPSQMSGGQRQRVAIARSLAKRPKMILGDELTGNLDTKTSKQVMESLIDTCRENKMTTLFVTHDASLTQYASRVIRLDSGNIVSDEQGGLSSISGKAKTLVKDVKKGAQSIAEDGVNMVKSVTSKASEIFR